MRDWQGVASDLITRELKKRNLSFNELSELLERIGIYQTPENLRAKIRSGTFGAALLLSIFKALNADITLPNIESVLNGDFKKSVSKE